MVENDAIVDIDDLKKTYGGLLKRHRVDALRGVSLTARAGDVFGLVGPNGAGKSTLIKILLGVVKPSAGKASLFGESFGSVAARQRVGYLPESLRIDRHHTARTALRFYGQLSRMSTRAIAARSDELLELVGLRERDRESVKQFSKGMCQRLGLAQALMHEPDLLVLDEPTDGLDPVGRHEVRKVIERLCDAGKTIFMNSHILQEVEVVCTHIAIMDRGRICGAGTIDELAKATGTRRMVFEIRTAQPQDSVAEYFAEANSTSLQIAALPSKGLTHRVVAELDEQSKVDRVVDQLRAANVSILRMEERRPALEDTFMQLLQNPSPADDVDSDQVEL